MARNFEGLGLGIEVDDGGSTKKLKGLGGVVEGMWDDLKKVGSLAPTIGRKIGSGLGKISGMGATAVGGIGAALAGAIDAANDPQLDNAFSSQYASFNKMFSALTVGTDMSAKEFKKMQGIIGGAAIGLNADMDSVGKSWLAFRKQNVDLAKVLGSKGTAGAVKDLIKVTDVYGIEGEQLANVTAGLIKSFSFTEEGVGSLADKVFVAGKAFNLGQEAIQAWPSLFESINKETANFGRILSPEEIDKLTTSLVTLGGGFSQSMGLLGPQGFELARTTFEALAGERKNILKMFTGREAGFGDIVTQLAETGGDVQGVFKMMSEGDPLKFMDMIREMAKVAQTKGGDTGIAFQRLTQTIDEALGADVTFAMKGSWDSVRDKIAEIPALLSDPKTKGAFTDAADLAHRTGRTMGDSWQLMLDSAKARLFRFSDKDVRAWMVRMKKGFGKTTGVIKEFASDKGPIGELTRKFLLFQRVGISAFSEKLGTLAPLFSGISDTMFPMMTALGSMGLKFSTLGKMAVGGGALYGLFYLLKHGPEETLESIKKLGKTLEEFGMKNFPTFTKAIRDKIVPIFDFAKSLKGLSFGEGLEKSFDFAKNWLSFIIDKTPFRKVGDTIKRIWKKIDWKEVFRSAIGGLGELAIFVGELIGTAFKKIDVLGLALGLASIVGKLIVSAFRAAFSTKEEDEAGKIAEASIGGTLGKAILAGFVWAKDKAKEGAQDLVTGIFHPSQLKESAGGIAETIMGGTAIALAVSSKFRGKFIGGIKSMFSGLRNMSSGGMKGFTGGIKSGLGRSVGAMRGFAKMIPKIALLSMAIEAVDQFATRSANILEIFKDKTISSFDKVGLIGREVFKGLLEFVNARYLGIPLIIGRALGLSETILSNFYECAVTGFESMISLITGFWTTLKDSIVNIVTSTWDFAVSAFDLLINKVFGREAADRVFVFFKGLSDKVMYPLQLLAHKLQGWGADLFEMLFGTAAKPGKMADLIKQFIPGGEELVKAGFSVGKDWRKQYEKEGGKEDFGKWYDTQAAKEMEAYKKERAKTTAGGRVEKAVDQLALGTAKIVERGLGQIGNELQFAGEEAQRRIAGKGEGGKIVPEPAYARESTEAWDVPGEMSVPVASKKTRGRRFTPSSAERAESVAPTSDNKVGGLLNSVASLTNSMAAFTAKPLQLHLAVEGDIGKFMKFTERQEIKKAPSIMR